MQIRPIRPDDYHACRVLYNTYVTQTTVSFEEEELSEEAYRARIEGVRAGGYPFLVAEDENGILGFAYLSPLSERSAYRYTADLSIYLAMEDRGRGIGSALLSAVEEEGGKRGLRHLISIITEENAASVRFHEKHGFLREGFLREVGEKFGRTIGVYYYRKPLG